MIEYKVDDKEMNASFFVSFVNQIWQGDYNIERTQVALSKTINITAYDGNVLVGCLRILSDGYYFGTITELLVLPEYQQQGIGSKLLQLAKDNTPTMLYFGAQPGIEAFYEKNGCTEKPAILCNRKEGIIAASSLLSSFKPYFGNDVLQPVIAANGGEYIWIFRKS